MPGPKDSGFPRLLAEGGRGEGCPSHLDTTGPLVTTSAVLQPSDTALLSSVQELIMKEWGEGGEGGVTA